MRRTKAETDHAAENAMGSAEVSESATELQKLLDREAQICADLRNPDVRQIDIPPAFFAQQIGLHTIMADPIGRIWDVTATPIRMIFDPLFFTRKKEK